MYEIICLEEIKNYHKYSGKCYYKQQYKGILEAGMISTLEGRRDNIAISLSMSLPVKKPRARKALCQFYEVLNVKQKTSVNSLGANESDIKDIITCHMSW